MIAFIDAHRAADGVEPICRVLPIAPSTSHAHVVMPMWPAALTLAGHRPVSSVMQS